MLKVGVGGLAVGGGRGLSGVTMSDEIMVLDWGKTGYEAGLREQEALLKARLEGEGGDVLVLTEHEPVFTIGLRAGAERHLRWDAERRKAEGVEVFKTNRGGDVTYHGPGQLVAYPVVSLERRRDLHAYLRFIEEVLIGTTARFGVVAGRRDGLTGIWVGERKVAAIGVAVRRWVAYHGLALNVSANLDHFSGIVPCGIREAEGTVTSLEVELGKAPTMEAVKAVLAEEFQSRWGAFLSEK